MASTQGKPEQLSSGILATGGAVTRLQPISARHDPAINNKVRARANKSLSDRHFTRNP
jgi:hypothetical protein